MLTLTTSEAAELKVMYPPPLRTVLTRQDQGQGAGCFSTGGVALAVGAKSGVASLAELGPDLRVGVPVGSITSMTLGRRGVKTSPFAFEDDIMDALAKLEVDLDPDVLVAEARSLMPQDRRRNQS